MKTQTSLLLATASCLAITSSLRAAVLVEESFNYTPGSNLAGANGGSGFDGAWTANASDYTIAAGLSYSGLASSGGSVSVVGNGSWSTSAKRDFTTINTTTGVVWGSYLVRPDVIGDDGFEVKYGEDDNINWGIASAFGNGGGTQTSLNANSNDGRVYGPTLVVGQTHLIVWAFNASAAEVDGIFPGDFIMFLDPTIGTDPDNSSPNIYKYTGASPQSTLGVTQIFARNTTATVDELRIGDSYASVTPAIPEPSAAVLGALGAAAAVGIRRRKTVV